MSLMILVLKCVFYLPCPAGFNHQLDPTDGPFSLDSMVPKWKRISGVPPCQLTVGDRRRLGSESSEGGPHIDPFYKMVK